MIRLTLGNNNTLQSIEIASWRSCVMGGAFQASRCTASVRNTENGENKLFRPERVAWNLCNVFLEVITLSSNASRVSFEFLQYYLDKKGKNLQSKGDWMENWSKIVASKRCRKGFPCGYRETFPKSATTFLTSPTFPFTFTLLFRFV